MLQRILAVALSAVVLALTGCGRESPKASISGALAGGDPETQSKIAEVRTPNSEAPQWVVRHPPGKRPDTVLIFMHGIFGDTLGTWKNAKAGKHFYELVAADPRLGDQVDEFAFGFPTTMLKRGSFHIQESADWLYGKLLDQDILQYKRIVIVAHSMGGLVALRALLTHRDLLPKVPLMVFFSTPQEGAQITVLARRLLNNPALDEMLPQDHNGYLQQLDADWKNIDIAQRPHISCAYEKLAIAGIVIVPYASATRYCSEAALAVDADHVDIVKPADVDSPAYVALSNALRKFALAPPASSTVPESVIQGTLQTPDFAVADGKAVLKITDPHGKREVHITNLGPGRLRYVLEQFPDRDLFVIPGIGPRYIDEGKTDTINLVVGYQPLKAEYQFILTSSGAPPLPVTVQIENMAAVQAFQREVASSVFDALLAASKEPGGIPDADSVTKITANVVSAKYGDRYASSKWLLTAGFLDSVRWPSQTVAALRYAERETPSIVNDSGVQKLAASSAYYAGESRVFESIPSDPQTVLATYQVDLNSSRPTVLFTNDPRLRNQAKELATAFKDKPDLAALGNSIQGDVAYVQGDFLAAASSYDAAFKIHATPSAAERLATSQIRLQKPESAIATFDDNSRRFPGMYSDKIFVKGFERIQ